jgi:hypothetical protein
MGVVGLIIGAVLGFVIPSANAASPQDRGTSLRAPGERPSIGVSIFLAVVLGGIGYAIGSAIG